MRVGELIEMLQQYSSDWEVEVVEKVDGFKSKIVECGVATYDEPFLQLLTETCKNGRDTEEFDTGRVEEVARKVQAAVRKSTHPDCAILFTHEEGGDEVG